jgi:hypothetical protein
MAGAKELEFPTKSFSSINTNILRVALIDSNM